MNLIQRKPRPLRRDLGGFRDDRLIIIACDDTYAPKQYFDFFKLARIKVHVEPTTDGTCAAPHVLNRLLDFDHDDDDELWLMLDTDHYTSGNHLKLFIQTIQEAYQRGVNVALSKPCFEFWLLLHHVDANEINGLKNARETGKKLREIIGKYDKTRLEKEHYPIDLVSLACNRAEQLDLSVSGGHIPDGNTSRVYLIWKAIAAKSLPTQLPVELQALIKTQKK